MRKILATLALFLLLALPATVFAGLGGVTPIPAPPNYTISTPLQSLCKGVVNYVPITITNKKTLGGPQMQNIVLSLVNSKTVYAYSNSTLNAGTINTSSSKTFYMPLLVSANASSYTSIEFAINYYFYNLYSDSETTNMSFSTYSCPTPLSITLSPKIIPSGSVRSLVLNLTNTGNTVLSQISLSIAVGKNNQNNSATIIGQPPFVPSLAPKRSVQLNTSVYLTVAQLFPIYITGTFFNGSTLNQVSDNTYLMSGGLINLSPSGLTITPSSPTAGSVFSASFELTNTGTTGATSVSVTAMPPSGIAPFTSNYSYVGTISGSGQSSVSLAFTTSNTLGAGTYKIPVKVSYLDGLLNNVSTWANFTVTLNASKTSAAAAGSASRYTTTSGSSSSGGSYVIPAILVVAVAALAWLVFKTRRHAKKIGAIGKR
jgi:hypothetical protein